MISPLSVRLRSASPSTVVAAYDHLQAQGLIEVRPQRGFFVREVQAGRTPRMVDTPIHAPHSQGQVRAETATVIAGSLASDTPIGPTTAAALREAGLTPAAVPEAHTTEGVLAALEGVLANRPR